MVRNIGKRKNHWIGNSEDLCAAVPLGQVWQGGLLYVRMTMMGEFLKSRIQNKKA